MKIAVLKESRPGERRVALVPEVVGTLVEAGARVVVEPGAGGSAAAPDAAYREAGAEIANDRAAALEGAEVVVAVQAPEEELPSGTVLIGLLDPLGDPERAASLAEAGVTAFAMELVPRTTRAQRMDALSSQATVAGYGAVLQAATRLPRLLPMLTTAAGTIRPGRALVLGAGVAGLQAIATARRLGARVEAFDVRPEAREQVESLGATFLETAEELAAEGEGGYAAELSEDQHARELELIAEHIRDADIVITTAQIPGRPAPVLITEAMVEAMKPGAVIVDLAGSTGGNCELSEFGAEVVKHGITLIAPENLPSAHADNASRMYAKNVSAFLLEMIEEGRLTVDLDNDVVGPSCLTHGGEVRHPRVRSALGLPEPVPGAGGGDRPAHPHNDPSTDAPGDEA